MPNLVIRFQPNTGTRPIEGENTDWSSISSNYLRGAQIVDGAYQKDGLAPNSAHIMWTKPLDDGGVVGGTNTGINGMTYYAGLSYETKFMGTTNHEWKTLLSSIEKQ